MRTPTLILLGLIAAAPALQAQEAAAAAKPEVGTPRAAQVAMLEHQRTMLLKMADSMPEQFYRDKVTEPQRDFAGQIHHAASAAAMISQMTMNGQKPTLPDTATAFNTRAGLKQYVNAAYDYAGALLKGQAAAARAETVKLFGKEMPRWQVWDEIHMHTVWTAGQVVANFRKHGMAPPSFAFF